MIEYRLYEFEKWQDGNITDRLTVLATPKQATWYALQGYSVFDYHESLDMEPEYYETEGFQIIRN
jgi:hypothetical protein